jgi:hypothetical protein
MSSRVGCSVDGEPDGTVPVPQAITIAETMTSA